MGHSGDVTISISEYIRNFNNEIINEDHDFEKAFNNERVCNIFYLRNMKNSQSLIVFDYCILFTLY